MTRSRMLIIEKCEDCPHCSKDNYLKKAHCWRLNWYIADGRETREVRPDCPLPLSDW